MKKGFTLIEMLVTVTLVAMLATVAVLTLSSTQLTSATKTGADEIKTLFEELRSYSVGPAQERATHYLLVISTRTDSTEDNVCNAQGGATNHIGKGEYMFCYTNKQFINTATTANLNSDYYRIRSGTLDAKVNISGPAAVTVGSMLVFNARTYDYALGYKGNYANSDVAADRAIAEVSISVKDVENKYSKVIKVDPIVNKITIQ